MAAVDDLPERKPVAESACNSSGNYTVVERDTPRKHNHDLCPQCFPDGEIDEEIDWLLSSRWGTHLHKSREDGPAEYQSRSTEGASLADKLSDPDVTSVADLQEGDE